MQQRPAEAHEQVLEGYGKPEDLLGSEGLRRAGPILPGRRRQEPLCK